jgi:hypothetical protein
MRTQRINNKKRRTALEREEKRENSYSSTPKTPQEKNKQ